MHKDDISYSCDKIGITVEQFHGSTCISHLLVIPESSTLPEGFKPVVAGNLTIHTNNIPVNFKPVVNGNLYLSNLIKIPEGFEPVVSGDIHLESVTLIPDWYKPVAGGNIHLNLIPSDIILDSFTCKHIITLGATIDINPNMNHVSWMDGKYVMVDGIFTEVKHTKGVVCKVKRLDDPMEFYLVTDGKGAYAHGKSIKYANDDLMFKLTGRNVQSYTGLTMDSALPFEEAATCYRVVTGACSYGTEAFIEKLFKNDLAREFFTIREIIDVSRGEYRNKNFEDFFAK